jgi:hypothetical protein
MISLGAAIVLAPLTALAPVAALAQTDQPAAAATKATPAGSHKSPVRHSSNKTGEKARTSAKHMHHMRHPGQP